MDIFRYDIHEIKYSLGLSGIYKDRSPVDCKALQSALKFRFGFKELPSNMLPVSQLEAILGAYLGYLMKFNDEYLIPKVKSNYQGIDVVGIESLVRQGNF